MKTLFFLLLLAEVLLATPLSAATYSNPVLPGDFPDPSVIRVGKEYWATATTSEWAPLFPLLHSRDLANWEHVANVFTHRPDWAVGNFWAPEISAYKGSYYIYFVGRRKGGPLSISVATAANPSGPWKDHGPLIGQEDGSIDPVTAIDESGDRYLIWKEDGNSRKRPTPLWIQKLSSDGTQLIGEMKEIMRNDSDWEGQLIEGPFVLRHGGFYYLFYSGAGCCGRGCNYALGVARSKSLFGPWEKNPLNPILGANDFWKCPGHGSIVDDSNGHEYLLYHSYQATNFIYVGRQGLLDQLFWGADGWPSINSGRGPSTQAEIPNSLAGPLKPHEFRDDFSAATLKPQWQWPQNNEPKATLLPDGHPGLLLSPAEGHRDPLVAAVLAIKTTTGDYAAVTKLNPDAGSGNTIGLSAFGDAGNALGVSVRGNELVLWRRQRNTDRVITTNQFASSSTLWLKMTAAAGHKFQFASSPDGNNWLNIGSGIDLEGDYLPPWDRGIRIALVTGGENSSARFHLLDVTPSALPRVPAKN